MVAYQEVVSQLMVLAPQLKGKYQELNTNFRRNLSDQDLEESRLIEDLHGLQSNQGNIGVSVVFENLFIPCILELANDQDKSTHLSEVMNWVESLANSDIFAVSNLVAGSVCEPLIASHEDKLSNIFPYMGRKTRELCKMQFSRFIITNQTKIMFQSVR